MLFLFDAPEVYTCGNIASRCDSGWVGVCLPFAKWEKGNRMGKLSRQVFSGGLVLGMRYIWMLSIWNGNGFPLRAPVLSISRKLFWTSVTCLRWASWKKKPWSSVGKDHILHCPYIGEGQRGMLSKFKVETSTNICCVYLRVLCVP